MKKPGEPTPGGSVILRHQGREREWQPPAESKGLEEIERHVAHYFGEPATVFHEVVSDLVHLDVHVIPPGPEREHWTLFTTGMSDLPMTTPEAAAAFKHAELMIFLPADWRIDLLQSTPPPKDLERWYWPIRWLKQLARLPHDHDTWLGMGHTIPNGDPPAAFAPGTELCCWLLLPPVSVAEEAREIAVSDGRTVHLLVLHALYSPEVAMKLAKGTDALLEAFGRANVSEVLTLDRPPTTRRKLFGIF